MYDHKVKYHITFKIKYVIICALQRRETYCFTQNSSASTSSSNRTLSEAQLICLKAYSYLHDYWYIFTLGQGGVSRTKLRSL